MCCSYLFAGLAEALQALLQLTAVVLRRLDALLGLLQEQVHLHRHPAASCTQDGENHEGPHDGGIAEMQPEDKGSEAR